MTPINGYVQIEPEEHKDFIASVNTTYDEIGKVMAVPDDGCPLKVGVRVFFDSWMASKFPMGDGKYYWYVPYENIKAYEESGESLSKVDLQGRISARLQDHLNTPEWSAGEVQEMRNQNVLPTKNTEP